MEAAFATAERHKERQRAEARRASGYEERKRFRTKDFLYDEKAQTCVCPGGHKLYRSGREMVSAGWRVARFKAPKSACRTCPLRAQGLRHPERSAPRQVQFFTGRAPQLPERSIDVRRRKFDSPGGRSLYAKRMGTVEPVCGNTQNKGRRRFTLRGQKKVDTQWKLYMLVQNIEKIADNRGAP